MLFRPNLNHYFSHGVDWEASCNFTEYGNRFLIKQSFKSARDHVWSSLVSRLYTYLNFYSILCLYVILPLACVSLQCNLGVIGNNLGVNFGVILV